MPHYRVEELAAEAGISVELLRSYQSKGLLPPPRHEGRLAIYGDRHLERLRSIRDLKARGYALKAIAGLLNRPEPPPQAPGPDGLLAGVASRDDRPLTLRQVAERTRVPPSLLRSLEASGVLRPRRIDGKPRYTAGDVGAVRMLLSLIGGGVPMEQFMAVARNQIEASEDTARGAIDLFMHHVREPLLASGLPEAEEAERLAAAFRLMLHATTALLTYNFQRCALNALQEELERRGSAAEREALARPA